MKLKEVFNKFLEPKIIGIVGDSNSGKSNLAYNIIKDMEKEYDFQLYSYGLKSKILDNKIYSVTELEQIKNSIIIIDEMFSLFDLEDRKKRKLIERTLRLIYHNNNVLILIGLPENFKKFISSKLNIMIYMKCTIADFINGSRVKNICLDYKGSELGSSVLELNQSEAIIYDGNYRKMDIKYLEEFDSKKENHPIISAKSVSKKEEKIK